MIVTEIVEIEKNKDDLIIEQQLIAQGKTPLRWAIVDVTDYQYKISVSYQKTDL